MLKVASELGSKERAEAKRRGNGMMLVLPDRKAIGRHGTGVVVVFSQPWPKERLFQHSILFTSLHFSFMKILL